MYSFKYEPALTMFMIVITLTLMPTLIHGHGNRRSVKTNAMVMAELANGSQLVMKTYSGNTLIRPAREAIHGENTVTANAPVGALAGENARVKNNNKKSNKPHSKLQHADRRRPSLKKSGVEQLHQGQRNSIKQQQMPKPQKQDLQHDASKRSGAKSKSTEKATTCRYAKSSWTECDSKTNMRTRTLSLKKGDTHCLPTRTIQKKCKRSCRYEKGLWSECNAGHMAREDKLRPSEDGSQKSCNLVRIINKKCNPGAVDVLPAKVRKHKEKGPRHASPQA